MNYLIVAVYNETWGWTEEFKPEWTPVIIRKNFDLPNLGREASSYFFGIHKLYDWIEPDDRIACVQGRPFDHCPDLRSALQSQPKRFAWIGEGEYTCDGHGLPHAAGMDLDLCIQMWCNKEPRTTYEFVPGGQFIVSGRVVLERGKQWYADMARLMCEYDNTFMSAYTMERLWKYLWT